VNEPEPFAAAQDLPLELLGPPEPPPPVRPCGATVLRTMARVILWSLITIGAVRGLVPGLEPGRDRATAVTVAADRQAPSATAARGRQAGTSTGADAGGAGAVAAAGDRQGGAAAVDRRAEAVAAAFLREYLTVGGDRAGVPSA
jgi:hypothetical protein